MHSGFELLKGTNLLRAEPAFPRGNVNKIVPLNQQKAIVMVLMLASFGFYGLMNVSIVLSSFQEQQGLVQTQPATPSIKKLIDQRNAIKQELINISSRLRVLNDTRKSHNEITNDLENDLQYYLYLLKIDAGSGKPSTTIRKQIQDCEEAIIRAKSSRKEIDSVLDSIESKLLSRSATLGNELRSIEEQLNQKK